MRANRLLPIKVEVVDSSRDVTGRAGLSLVADTMNALGLSRILKANIQVGQRRGDFSVSEKIESLILLQAAGGSGFDDIETLRADEGLCRLLGREFPASSTVRDFAYQFHGDDLIEKAKANRPEGEVSYIPEENPALAGLGVSQVKFVRQVARQRKLSVATVDYDATICESHNREALAHYKHGRGYQPSIAIWAEADLVLVDEYRDGNVPAGTKNLPVIQRAFEALPPGISTYQFRSDSAAYEHDVLKWLLNEKRSEGPNGKIGFTISADMSKQLRAECVALPEDSWKFVEDRPHETVHCGEVEFLPGDWAKDSPPVRYVAYRMTKKQTELFDERPETKYLAVASNRWEMRPIDLLRWHWEKAGTIEHVHHVVKNELGAGVVPTFRFGANAFWFRVTLMTYNVLSALRTLALGSDLAKARPKRLRFTVFTIAGKIASGGRYIRLRISEAAERAAGYLAARSRLAAIAAEAG